MDLKAFVRSFPNEEQCKRKFKKMRDEEGLTCPRCGNNRFHWLSEWEQYKCKQCKHKFSLKSGTLLHASKLPYRYWFIVTYFVLSKSSNSLRELQDSLGHKYYNSIWKAMDKVRQSRYKQGKKYIKNLNTGIYSVLIHVN